MVHITISQTPPPQAQLKGRTRSFELDAEFDGLVDALMPRAAVASPAWLDQVRRNAVARQEFLDAVGALTAEEVADLAGSQAHNRRQTAHRWAESNRIFAVELHDRVYYPGFQFDPTTGRPLPQIADAIAALPQRMTGWDRALWWTSPAFDRDGDVWVEPLHVLDDRDMLVRLATITTGDWLAAGAA